MAAATVVVQVSAGPHVGDVVSAQVPGGDVEGGGSVDRGSDSSEDAVEFTVGRSRACTLRLHLDKEVSSKHAHLRVVRAGPDNAVTCHVMDLGSTNGTLVRDGTSERLLDAHREATLCDGQCFVVGNSVLTVQVLDDVPADVTDTASGLDVVDASDDVGEIRADIDISDTRDVVGARKDGVTNVEASVGVPCPLCGIELSRLLEPQRSAHVNGCLGAPEEGADGTYATEATCPICGKDLAMFNSVRRLQHANKCISAACSPQQPATPAVPVQPQGKRALVAAETYHCPKCGKDLSSAKADARVKHVRACKGTGAVVRTTAARKRRQAKLAGTAKRARGSTTTAKADVYVVDPLRDLSAINITWDSRPGCLDADDEAAPVRIPDSGLAQQDGAVGLDQDGAVFSQCTVVSGDPPKSEYASLNPHLRSPETRRARGRSLWTIASLSQQAGLSGNGEPYDPTVGFPSPGAPRAVAEKTWATLAPPVVRAVFPAWRENITFLFDRSDEELSAAMGQVDVAMRDADVEVGSGAAAKAGRKPALQFWRDLMSWLMSALNFKAVQSPASPVVLPKPSPVVSRGDGIATPQQAQIASLSQPVIEFQMHRNGLEATGSKTADVKALSAILDAGGPTEVAKFRRALRAEPGLFDKVLLMEPIHLSVFLKLAQEHLGWDERERVTALLDTQGITFSVGNPTRRKNAKRYR